MDELLLIGAGLMGRPYITAAESLGYRVRVVETESWLPDPGSSAQVRPIAGLTGAASGADEAWALGAYSAVAEGWAGGVLAFAEPHVVAAALIQDRLGVAGPSLHAAVVSRNKALQRACFRSCGIAQPEFHLATQVQSAVAWAGPRLPVVVKPLSASGSAGVESVADPARLAHVLEERLHSGRVLVEQAVQGPEFSWEGLVREGRILFGNFTAKETTGPPHFVEIAHRCGHVFAEADHAKAADAFAGRVVSALGMRTGVVHLEFRMADAGPVLMEVAVRTPGDFMFELISRTHGFDPYLAAVALAMDAPMDVPDGTAPGAFAGIWFPSCAAGEVVEIRGLEEAARHPFVVRSHLAVGVGDSVPALAASRDRVGHVLFEAPTRAQRDSAMAEVLETLRIVTDAG